MAFRQFSRVFMLPKVKYCICKYVQQTKRSSGSNNGTQSSTLLDRLIKCNCLLCRRCTPLFDEYLHEAGDAEWLIDVVYQSLCIFAVPVFFMISGANLLGYRKKYDTKTFL